MKEDQITGKIFERIEREGEEFLNFAAEMVRIPSFNPPGNYNKIAEMVNHQFQAFGLETRVISTPENLVKEAGLEYPRHSVLGRLAGQGTGRSGILCLHLDTVPVENEALWTHPPFGGEIKDGRLWGRGACDCKGRIASFGLALSSIRREGITLGGDVILAATADEEIGGYLGAGYLVSQGLLEGSFCIIEGFTNEMLYGYAGTLHFKVITRGKAAHTAQPWRGVNAILKMEKVIQTLTRIQQELSKTPSRVEGMRYTTLNIGTIRGGAKASIVPDYCELEVDTRLVPEDRAEAILDRVNKGIEEIRTGDPDFVYEVQVIRKNEAYHSDPNSDLVQAIQTSLAAAGAPHTPIPVTMSRGGSDMKFFVPRGIPCVAFGAVRRPDSNIHGADENILISDFILAAKTTVAALVKMMGAR